MRLPRNETCSEEIEEIVKAIQNLASASLLCKIVGTLRCDYWPALTTPSHKSQRPGHNCYERAGK
ncbi:hypothetical protein Pint_19658 [Pistacia integerrima]|uniref:Uncharacterized protein n=1 Tax=Pistacia integerrima TaxID=434235 RepID=A0ACC0XBN7_9ROSI|nr:hypothetical protein Pint_19658 [Pistacia integerrima]